MFYGEIFPNMENSIFSFILFIIKHIIIIFNPSLYFMENYHENMENYLTHICGCFINLNLRLYVATNASAKMANMLQARVG
jgi:hypothetical protein